MSSQNSEDKPTNGQGAPVSSEVIGEGGVREIISEESKDVRFMRSGDFTRGFIFVEMRRQELHSQIENAKAMAAHNPQVSQDLNFQMQFKAGQEKLASAIDDSDKFRIELNERWREEDDRRFAKLRGEQAE